MKQLTLLSVLLLCFACSGSSDKNRDTGNAVNDPEIPANAIPVVYFDYLHLHLRIDSAEGTFLFDTGFDNLCIDSIFYYSNKLEYINSTTGKIYGIGNAYQNMNLIRDTLNFSIDGRRYRTSLVPVIDLKPIGGDYVDGLLGTKYFAGNVVEINYIKDYIRLCESVDSIDTSGYSRIPLKNMGSHYFVPLTLKVNDTIVIAGNFMIDTATPGSTLTSYIAYRNNLSSKIDHKILFYTMYGGIGGESSGYDFAVDSLKIADFDLPNVILSYSLDTAGSLAAEEYIGILGNNILERFDLIFDFINGYLYLRPNSSFSKPYAFDRMGFSYVDRCKTMGGWIVAGLYENSPAEKEGLRIDDKIISVNEKSVEEIPYEKQSGYFDKIKKVKLVVSREGQLHNIEFELEPVCDL